MTNNKQKKQTIKTLKKRINVLDMSIGSRLQRPAWDGNNTEKRVYKGRTLQRERARLFNANPLCAECERQGRVTVATIRDHIIPLAEGGQDTADNIQGLCEECHNKKTAAESKRGASNHQNRI